MRSIFIALFILFLGILTALPFRKNASPNLVTVPSEPATQQPAFATNLREYANTGSGGLMGQLNGDAENSPRSRPSIGRSSRTDYAMPEVSNDRPAYSESFIEPDLVVSSPSTSSSQREPQTGFQIPDTLATSSMDWNLDLPMSYVPSTGLDVEAVASKPAIGSAVSDRAVPSTQPSMRLTQTGWDAERAVPRQPIAENQRVDQSQMGHSSVGPGVPNDSNRKRYFIYEPEP